MKSKFLVLAYGNPGRQDDGLGPRCAERLEQQLAAQQHRLPVTIECNYQLTVEDTLLLSEVEKVIFVDAIKSSQKDFLFTTVEPMAEFDWNYHLLSPPQLLSLCTALFSKAPEGFLLAIEGYQFDQFMEQLSTKAENNMHMACQFLHNKLEEWSNTT